MTGKVTSTTVSFSRKVQPRQFNPVDTFMSETITFDGTETPEERFKARSVSFKRLKKQVDRISEYILEDEAES